MSGNQGISRREAIRRGLLGTAGLMLADGVFVLAQSATAPATRKAATAPVLPASRPAVLSAPA